MKYNTIPNTTLQVSVFALGTWVFSGDVWGAADEKDSIEAVHAALDSGINCIDTAPIYGNGRSESIVGKAIQNRRDKVILATKCGLKLSYNKIVNDLTPGSILQEAEASLKRLNTDYIDLYQCHWPDVKTQPDETIKALLKLKDDGKVRYIGISNYTHEQIQEFQQLTPLTSLQSQYSLLDFQLEKNIIPFLLEHNIGLIPYGVLGGGILSGKYKKEPNFKGSDARKFFYKYYKGKNFEYALKFLSYLETINRPLNQIALNWIRQQPVTLTTLVGCRTKSQVLENVKAVEWNLTDVELKSIQKNRVEFAYA